MSDAELLRQQTTLAQFGELALRSDDLEAILTEACRLVSEALGTDLAKVMELRPDGETLLVRAGVGWKPGIVGAVMVEVADDTSEGHALRTGKPMISSDIAAETRFRYPAFLTDHGVKAMANVPIIGAKDKPPFGILQVDSREPRWFTDGDTAFLSSYANLLAAAVDRLRIVGELRQVNEALEARVAERTAELMAAEAALRQSQKMEAVGQLTGGIAHDFNNMLQAIGSSLELMQGRIARGRVDEAGQLAEAARGTVKRAAALTHRLLAFARRQVLQPRPVDLDALIGGMAELVRRTVEPAITVELRLGDGLSPVSCDPHQLENALLNLAINARDAMPGGGTLTISTADVRLSPADVAGQEGAQPGPYVEIAVADTGTGMDEATRERAFEPFFTTKPIGQGTGLGLSQLHGFARQSGGCVRLDSAPGQGTTVRFYLPRHERGATAEAIAPDAAEGGLPTGAGGTVLLVEDEAQVRAVAAQALRELGHHVLEAGDGAAALRVLQGSLGARVDVLVTDVGLPGGLNGRQVAEMARERRPGLPVLFITGYAGAALEGQLVPGMEVIGKPFALDALANRVRAMIEAASASVPR